MKKSLIALLVVLLIGAVAVVTCPDKQAHKDAIMSVINEKINDALQTDDTDLQGLGALFGTIGSSIATRVLDNRLTVRNHFLWSTGEIQDLKGTHQQISLGFLGHVFTFSKEDLDHVLEEML